MRIMAFDFGSKRIGIAVSDALPMIASPIGYISNDDKMFDEIKKLLDKYSPGRLVIGNPINMDGTPGKNTAAVKEFGERLKSYAEGNDVIFWDERLTSMQAEKLLIKGDVRRENRKGIIDKISAALILQNYLDFYNNSRKATSE
jgi:putative Holliday junction resolvase